MALEVRHYVGQQFMRYPPSNEQFPTSPLSSLVSLDGNKAKEIVERVDQLAFERFEDYHKSCIEVLSRQIVSEREVNKLIKTYRESGERVGEKAGPWVGGACGAAVGGAGGCLLTLLIKPQLVLYVSLLVNGVVIGKTESSALVFTSGIGLLTLFAMQNPLAGMAEAGALLSTQTEWFSLLSKDVGGCIGKIFGRMAVWMNPPHKTPNLKAWKSQICSRESEGLKGDLAVFKDILAANRAAISESDLGKLELIQGVLANRVEMVNRFLERLT